MRELRPTGDEPLDIANRLAADERPPPAGRPWVVMTMIASIDGAMSVDGRSGGLGGEADHKRFVAMRRLVDAIVVGASTIRAEDYRPTSVPIHVISGSLALPQSLRLFSDPQRPPVIYTTNQTAQDSASGYDGIAEVVALGDSIRPSDVLRDLDGRGTEVVGLEGGPTLNGQFIAEDLVDEILLTVSPLALGGNSSRIAHGSPVDLPRRFSVDRVTMSEDYLFVRYVRVRHVRVR